MSAGTSALPCLLCPPRAPVPPGGMLRSLGNSPCARCGRRGTCACAALAAGETRVRQWQVDCRGGGGGVSPLPRPRGLKTSPWTQEVNSPEGGLLGAFSCSPTPFVLEQSGSASVPREKRFCWCQSLRLEEGQGVPLAPFIPTHGFPEGLCSSSGGQEVTGQVKWGDGAWAWPRPERPACEPVLLSWLPRPSS